MATAPATAVDAGSLVFDRRRIIGGALAITVALNVANGIAIAAGADTEHTRYWLMALEWNPSSWFASALLAVTAAAAYVQGGRHWRTVAAALLVMSIDEIATLHERLHALPVIPGIGTRGWAGAGLLIAAVVAVRLLPWVRTLDAPRKRALLVGGALFVAGAIGFEVISGEWVDRHGPDATSWWLATIEEDLELGGVLVVLHALLGALARRAPIGVAVR
jgi:hypothetical protein